MYHFRKKIKLVIFTASLKRGGSQRVITYLCNYLDKKKFEITLVIVNNQQSLNSFSTESLNLKNIIDLKTSKVSLAYFKIIKTVNKINPDIIFSTQFHLNITLLLSKPFFSNNLSLIARETNIPSIRKKGNIIHYFIYKNFYKFFDAIVCQSSGMYDDLLLFFGIPKNKLNIINNPIDCNLLKEELNENKNIKDEYFKSNIVAIGSTLGPQKGFKRLIDSFSLIKDKDIKLFILGEGPSRKILQKKINKLGLQNQISLLGLKTNPLIYLKHTDVFALPSYSEGFPNSMLEAGICGIPTVAFDVKGGIHDILLEGINGFIVPDGDIKSYSEALKKALNFPFNKNKIRKHIHEKFDVSIIINDYETLILNTYNEKI